MNMGCLLSSLEACAPGRAYFSVEGQIVNISGSACPMISAATIQVCHYGTKAAINEKLY